MPYPHRRTRGRSPQPALGRSPRRQHGCLATASPQETLKDGNILRGWDGYLGKQASSGAIRRINRFREADRMFSASSVTSGQASTFTAAKVSSARRASPHGGTPATHVPCARRRLMERARAQAAAAPKSRRHGRSAVEKTRALDRIVLRLVPLRALCSARHASVPAPKVAEGAVLYFGSPRLHLGTCLGLVDRALLRPPRPATSVPLPAILRNLLPPTSTIRLGQYFGRVSRLAGAAPLRHTPRVRRSASRDFGRFGNYLNREVNRDCISGPSDLHTHIACLGPRCSSAVRSQ